MKKILEYGHLETMVKVCPRCGCKFAFDERDIENERYYNEYWSSSADFVTCPYCNEVIPIQKSIQPVHKNSQNSANTEENK